MQPLLFPYKGEMKNLTELAEIGIATRETLRIWIVEQGISPEDAVERVPQNQKLAPAIASDKEAWSGLDDERRDVMKEFQDIGDRTKTEHSGEKSFETVLSASIQHQWTQQTQIR